MFIKYSIFITLAMVMVVTANVIPSAVEEESYKITYEGNDLIVGERVPGDYQLTQFGIWGTAVPDTVITKTLDIKSVYEITCIHAYDRAVNQSSGSIPTLISGHQGGKTAKILFTSAPGKEIWSLADVYARR